jgi:hypothetical protein
MVRQTIRTQAPEWIALDKLQTSSARFMGRDSGEVTELQVGNNPALQKTAMNWDPCPIPEDVTA